VTDDNRTAGSSLQQLFELGVGAMALLAAHRVGLVRALLDRAATPDEFARDLSLDARATALTLNVLSTFGAAAYDGRYLASTELATLAATSPGGVFLDLDLYGHVGDYLVTGRPLIAMDGSLQARGEHYKQVAAGLGPRYARAAAALADRLGPDVVEVLDVGAGSGVWSLAVAERNPAARVTAVDLAPVLEVFQRNAKERSLERRVATIEGGYLDVDLPAGAFDCVFLGNVLHLEPPDRAADLVRRAARALRPGGRALIVDILGEGGHEPDSEHAMYALFLALRTREGRMYSCADVLGWIADAGLVEPAQVPVPDAPSLLSFLSATRPH
jgi:SAM-dependent methyltransferase